VEGGNVLRHVKREGKFSDRGNIQGKYVQGKNARIRSKDITLRRSCCALLCALYKARRVNGIADGCADVIILLSSLSEALYYCSITYTAATTSSVCLQRYLRTLHLSTTCTLEADRLLRISNLGILR